jgi:lipopolysaccharide export LptBFGC system permease protein LptF
MDFLLGFVLGAFVLALYYLLSKKSFFKKKSKEESVILLDKIKNVSKLITVEGNFNEIMHFSDVKNSLLNIVSSKKKAIIIANAKVYIGFNMKKAEYNVNPNKQTIKMLNFPKPEVLSIETDIEYYDVKNGLFNKFDASELTELNKKIKQNIADKIPESDLLISAQNKAIETLNIIEQMVDTFGWKLDYSKNNEIPKLDKKNILKKLLP